MHTAFKFNRAIVINTSKDNLAEGLDLIKTIKFFCHKNNVCCQNLNEIKKRYLICSTHTHTQTHTHTHTHTHTFDLLNQVRACISISRGMRCILIYLRIYIKKLSSIQKIINDMCPNKVSRLFARNLNEFSIHLCLRTHHSILRTAVSDTWI